MGNCCRLAGAPGGGSKSKAPTRGPNTGTRVMQNKKNTKTETRGSQADDLMSDLAAQHQYVEGLRKAGDKGFQLVATSAFVEGMRDSGYRSTATALDEF